jgi:hypothetical protein
MRDSMTKRHWKEYRLLEDIVIPAGTVVGPAPSSATYFTAHGEAVVGHGKDHASYWRIDVEDGLELGLLEEIDAE